MRTEFWWSNLLEGERFDDREVGERILLKLILSKWIIGM
jgi:hypothetical protein